MQENRSYSSNNVNNNNNTSIIEKDLNDNNGNDVSSLSQESQSSPSQSLSTSLSPSPCNSNSDSDHDHDNNTDTHTDTQTQTYHFTHITKNFNFNSSIMPASTTTTTTVQVLNSSNKALTGVIVNGFHPQLHTWQEKSNHHRTTSNGAGNNNFNINRSNRHKRSREQSSSLSLLDEKIQEKVSRARNETVKDLQLQQQYSIQNARHEEVVAAASVVVNLRREKPSVLKMYTDMFENSSVPQLITAPGGRIAAWNQEFLKICGVIRQNNTQSLDTLTAFDIVSPTMIPKLYEIFLMALTLDMDNNNHRYYYPCQGGVKAEEDEDDDEEEEHTEEDNDVKYPSLTVPCVNFGTHEQPYYITFSLMHDKNPDKRCFHCIIQKEPKVSIGEIYSVSQKFLMEML
mmetsp:Transcript_14604/g.18463  ORF Transcript_14604/g.18463 Transcript_14604/m.18463 type:complete len:400 (-) Transcript_14604:315-1514(-)